MATTHSQLRTSRDAALDAQRGVADTAMGLRGQPVLPLLRRCRFVPVPRRLVNNLHAVLVNHDVAGVWL